MAPWRLQPICDDETRSGLSSGVTRRTSAPCESPELGLRTADGPCSWQPHAMPSVGVTRNIIATDTCVRTRVKPPRSRLDKPASPVATLCGISRPRTPTLSGLELANSPLTTVCEVSNSQPHCAAPRHAERARPSVRPSTTPDGTMPRDPVRARGRSLTSFRMTRIRERRIVVTIGVRIPAVCFPYAIR